MLTISPVIHIIVSVIHMHMYIRAVGGVWPWLKLDTSVAAWGSNIFDTTHACSVISDHMQHWIIPLWSQSVGIKN